jgi:hypothetical protein
MTKPFRFRATDINLPTQKIIFNMDNDPTQEFPIPNETVPEDSTDRFWFLYNRLIELGVIPNQTPIYTPES